MLNGRVSELYGKDDKEDRDEEGGILGIQGRITCLRSHDFYFAWLYEPISSVLIGLFPISYSYSVLAVLLKNKTFLKVLKTFLLLVTDQDDDSNDGMVSPLFILVLIVQ